MSVDRAGGIAKLLDAEAKAKDIIEAAKRERAALQKQSKTEAEAAIAEFKASKDQEYKEMTAAVDTSDFAREQNEKTDVEIAQMRKESQAKINEVVELLLHHVSSVNTDVHKNNAAKP